MRLAHFGTFDVPNYGDLLFPLLAEAQLEGVVDEFVHVSPVGGQPYDDVPASIGVEELARRGERFDAVMVGGGNLLTARPSTLAQYSSTRRTAYPNLWAGAAQLAAVQDIPLVFNAPGVAGRVGRLNNVVLRRIAQQAAYFVVRDAGSARIAERSGARDVRIVPDSALGLRDVLGPCGGDSPVEGLEPGGYAVVHVNERYTGRDPEVVARELDRLARALGQRICLIAIGRCHGDDRVVRDVGTRMTTHPVVVDRTDGVRHIVRLIAGSSLYVGASLHGFITATSYGVPGLIVADPTRQHKFLGLLDQLDASSRLVPGFAAVTDGWGATTAISETWHRKIDLRPTLLALQEHWQGVRSAIVAAPPPASLLVRRLPHLGRAVAAADWADSGLRRRLAARLAM